MNGPQETISLTPVKQYVLRTLLYFDIFNYPLKAPEVFRFLGINSANERIVSKNLDELVSEGLIFRFDHFYTVQNEPALVNRRIRGNQMAEHSMILARKQARKISGFPFVKAVMASGSLSKGYMDEKSDLDFFVVTEPGKLWIARTLLVMYKRIFLFNSHKHFCVNYFVDHDHLKIEESNLFTATELATVIPLYNWSAYLDLQQENLPWLKDFFPNFLSREKDTVIQEEPGWLKAAFETLLRPFSRPLEKVLMKLTSSRWNRIYGKNYERADFNIAFKSKKHASKNHPQHFQKKVLDLYDRKLKEFATTNGLAGHE